MLWKYYKLPHHLFYFYIILLPQIIFNNIKNLVFSNFSPLLHYFCIIFMCNIMCPFLVHHLYFSGHQQILIV